MPWAFDLDALTIAERRAPRDAESIDRGIADDDAAARLAERVVDAGRATIGGRTDGTRPHRP